MNSLFVTRNQYEFIIFVPNWLWMDYSFHQKLWIQYLFRETTINSLSFSQKHYQPLSLLRINYDITLCYEYSLLIHHRFRDLSSISLIHHEFIILFRKFTLNSLFIISISFSWRYSESLSIPQIYYLFRQLTMY